MSGFIKVAKGIHYDNTASGYAATRVQEAIDENAAAIVGEDIFDRTGTTIEPANAGDDLDMGTGTVTTSAFESEVTTGTAPLTVASTTVVSNLNADQVDGKDETAFALLAGRAGGQTVDGGTLTTQILSLRNNAVDDLGFDIEADGILHSNVTNYETLVTSDDDVPNKKYVDDAIAVEDIWDEAAGEITPKNAGSNLDMGVGSVTYGTGLDSVENIRNAADVSKILLNSNGDSYLDGGNVGFGTTTPSVEVSINGGISKKMTDAGAAHYNPSALTADYKITANNTGAPRNIIISDEDIATGTPTEPREFLVSDYYGQAGANALTVSGESGTINGGANIPINAAYNSITIHSDGTNLTVV